MRPMSALSLVYGERVSRALLLVNFVRLRWVARWLPNDRYGSFAKQHRA